MIPVLMMKLIGFAGKPRASGDDPPSIHLPGRAAAVNPARAGMIRSSVWTCSSCSSKPRASGDDPSRGEPRVSREE